MPSALQSRETMNSRTPAAPKVWPKNDLLELTGGIARASLKTALIARVSAPSLSLVPVPWALT